MASHSKEPSSSAPAALPEEPSCSYSATQCSSLDGDAQIQTKINDLNQTFVKIINSLKIMNVHNRNSGRESLNSNGEMLSLFDDFLNISHLLNIKINYLYNTYASRSEVTKYISSINYKLYVFNINSFELSQEIDKGNRKHKKYQILHDLNISEMTNNVKLFNFVDEVEVEPDFKREETRDSDAFSSDDESELNDNKIKGNYLKDCEVRKQKQLKRKTTRQATTESHSSSDDSDSSLNLEKKKLKTNEDLGDDGDSVEMYNNLFKEINNNILELSKGIDDLSLLLRTEAPCSRRPVSPASSNEEEEEAADETGKKQTTVDRKLRKWQLKQMTRALIENMVNSIQEEYMSRREARSQRTLVNEAVLMAIQSIGLQREAREEADSSHNSPPVGDVSHSSPPVGDVSHSSPPVGDDSHILTPGKDRSHNLPPHSNSSVSLPQEALVSSKTRTSLRKSLLHGTSDRRTHETGSRQLDQSHETDKLSHETHMLSHESHTCVSDCDGLPQLLKSPQKSAEHDCEISDHSTGTIISSESNRLLPNTVENRTGSSQSMTTSEPSVTSDQRSMTSEETSVTAEEPMSDQYYDDDFMTRAVTVAISKKGLST